MPGEEVMRLLGLRSLPSDPEDRRELLQATEVLVSKRGEAWVSKHRYRLVGEFEAFTGIRLDELPSEAQLG